MIKFLCTPDRKYIVCAKFDTRMRGCEKGDPTRAKHYVFKNPGNFSYLHIVRFLVPADKCEPNDENGYYVSERVFFGKYRIVEISEGHLPETWIMAAHAVRTMEEYNNQVIYELRQEV